MMTSGYIAVDLDGTLAEYGTWQGAGQIGKPVPVMRNRVMGWLKDGVEVRIFTARVDGVFRPDFGLSEVGYDSRTQSSNEFDHSMMNLEAILAIRLWCKQHLGKELTITNRKDFGMVALYDDRCFQVEVNTGRIIGEKTQT